jgi:hypothetical protein
MPFDAEVEVTAAGNGGIGGTLLTADLMRADQRDAYLPPKAVATRPCKRALLAAAS